MFPASSKGGGVSLGFPDVCKTPAPGGGAIPVPYANQIDGMAEGGNEAAKTAQKQMIDNAEKKGYKAKSATGVAIASQGDVAGSSKGIISSRAMDKVGYQMGSSKVKVEGKGVTHHVGMTGHSGGNSNAPPGQQIAPSQTKVWVAS